MKKKLKSRKVIAITIVVVILALMNACYKNVEDKKTEGIIVTEVEDKKTEGIIVTEEKNYFVKLFGSFFVKKSELTNSRLGNSEIPVDPIVIIDPIPVDPIVIIDPIPVDPIGPIDPIVIIEPITPIDPIDPIVIIEPIYPIYPVDPVDPVDPEPMVPMIWKDGESVGNVDSYTLTNDMTTTTKYGLVAVNATIINEATIIGTNTSIGMSVFSGGTAINNGVITGDTIIGMEAVGRGSTAINNGTISNDGDLGMYARDRGNVLNKSGGFVSNTGSHGMDAFGKESTAINEGTIFNKGIYGMHASNGGNVINESGGFVSNTDSHGMSAFGRGSTAINNGTVSNDGDYGMYAFNEGTILNQSGGLVSNKEYYGMYALGEKTTGINEGTISNKENYGMSARMGGTVVNQSEGHISNRGDYGMNASGIGSVAINNGTISNDGNHRMHADLGGLVINNGSLDTHFNNYTVMFATGKGSMLINNSVIDVNHNQSVAMSVTNGGTAINNGTINLNADDGIGILVDGLSSSYTNNGDININSGTGNQDVSLINGATFYNSGSISTTEILNFDEMGDGKFIMESGGTIEAETLEGDFYASGALTMGGYEDTYTTYRMLKTNEINGEIISNTVMFDAEFTEQDENGYYDIVMIRNDFSTLIENSELGTILEESYVEDGNKLKEDYYDALKLSSYSTEVLNKNVENSYGFDVYTTTTKQTYDTIKNLNNVIETNIINNRSDMEVGEFHFIAGGNYNKTEEEFSSNISDYDASLYSIYLGGEKQLSSNMSIGGILSYGEGDIKYTETTKASREDIYFQGNAYLIYETNDKLKFTTMVFAGLNDASTERTLAFGTIYEEMKSDFKNHYVGINNAISKRYDLKSVYLKPKFKLDFTYVAQEEIAEKGDFGLKIDKLNSMSIETGIELALGKDFLLSDRHRFNVEASIGGYLELGDPYKDTYTTFDVLSDKKVRLEGYDGDTYYGEVKLRGNYKTSKLLTIYAEMGYRAGEKESDTSGSLGFNFLF